MNISSVKSCPICDNSSFSDFLTCTDHYATQEVFKLQKCSKCGFVFTQDFPSEAFIGSYYETPDYISHTNTKKGIVNFLYHYARSFMLNRKCKMIESISEVKPGKILDYGTGTGFFLNAIKSKGWEITGIEKSPSARAFAQKEFGLEILAPSALQSVQSESCDIITLWHVLEHIEDLQGIIGEFKRILKPNGRLILALPNSGSYDALHYKEYWAAYDVPRHLWHFTPRTLFTFAQNNGLTLLDKKGMPLDGFYISMISEKYKKNKLAFVSGLWVGIKGLFASMKDVSLNSSLIYILKK
ncbi:class I SAM-dependent methyltransferase [Parabacteroides sp. FAFU027]|uniref:class I SAM-dependent methyltransferase n=1 Tax=Parabacteroides sp. FAFU027 TaxID=2922715 RepID=UPI001FAEB012|nr:class I SAM-dependent methyltransferase [Parabacteroides sp. FAFU027]